MMKRGWQLILMVVFWDWYCCWNKLTPMVLTWFQVIENYEESGQSFSVFSCAQGKGLFTAKGAKIVDLQLLIKHD